MGMKESMACLMGESCSKTSFRYHCPLFVERFGYNNLFHSLLAKNGETQETRRQVFIRWLDAEPLFNKAIDANRLGLSGVEGLLLQLLKANILDLLLSEVGLLS